jgi:dihydrolipoamide dehydrogenase
MLHSAELADHARHSADFGINVGDVQVDIKKVLERKNKVVQQNAGGVTYLMKKNKVDVHTGWGSIAGPGQVKVSNDGTDTILNTRYCILATGSDPRVLPGMEIDGKRVLTSDELLDLEEIPSHLIVLGAGAVGVEFASVFRSFGSEVTIVEMADTLVPVEDTDVSKEFGKIFKRRGIKAHTATKLSNIEVLDDRVRARLEPRDGGKAQSVSGSHLLIAIGRKPLTDGIGLEKTKVEVDRGFVKANGFGQTGEAWIYAIGDIVAGTPLLAHAASNEGVIAVEHIAGLNPQPLNYEHVPGCTYSSPEVGSLGLTERAAREAGHTLKIGKFPFTAVGKAKVVGETAGFVKIVAEAEYDQILGIHIIGPRATDLIAEAGPVLKLEYTLQELTNTVHAHPTLSECIHEAAHAALGHALHM